MDEKGWVPEAREGSMEDLKQLLEQHRAVIMETVVRPIMPAGEEIVEQPEPVVTVPVAGSLLQATLGTRDTQVMVSVLADGDVTVRIMRKGQVVHIIDVDPEEGVKRMTDPNCDCQHCTERRARQELKH
jgi:hypothetical protein